MTALRPLSAATLAVPVVLGARRLEERDVGKVMPAAGTLAVVPAAFGLVLVPLLTAVAAGSGTMSRTGVSLVGALIGPVVGPVARPRLWPALGLPVRSR